MSFLATFSIITNSSLEMITNWSINLRDGKVGRRGGSFIDGNGDFSGIFYSFNFALFL